MSRLRARGPPRRSRGRKRIVGANRRGIPSLSQGIGQPAAADPTLRNGRMTTTRRPLVLVVDDDPGARLLQSAALEAGGFDIQTAANGSAALEVFKNTLPDCMVLDVVMPGLNGYKVCAEIRSLPQVIHAPILILTSLDDRDSISLAYAAGASDFAQKGLAPLLLVERVR